MHAKVPMLLLLALLVPAIYRLDAQHKGDPVPPSWTQNPGETPTPKVSQNNQPFEDAKARMIREQQDRLSQQRQLQAVADAARLAQLSKELQEELTRARGATLPANAFKKADDIIKLAKSVKDKMRPL